MKILDMSAGNRAMWFDKTNPLATFLDIRECVKPTFVCNTTSIPPEVGNDFDLVVFDPPHENTSANSNMADRYGHWTRLQITNTIVGSGREAHRVTREKALMAFKWNNKAWSLDKVLKLIDQWWVPLFGSHLRNQGGSSAKTQTYWVMLLRK